MAFPKNKRAIQGLDNIKKTTQNNITQNPPQEIVSQLINLYKQGKLLIVVDQAKMLTKKYPDSTVFWNILGIANIGLSEFKQALESFNKVIKLNPNFAEAHNNMGLALQNLGKLDESIQAYKKAVLLKPDYAGAYYNMGNAFKDKDKLDNAVEAYNKSILLKPDYVDAYNNMGNVLKDQGKLNTAIEAYNRAIKLKPDNVKAYKNMGIALEGMIFKKPNPSLQNAIISLLDQQSCVRPKNIAKSIISLLKLEPILKIYLQGNLKDKVMFPIKKIIKDLSELTLLLKLMNVCPITDIELENLLRQIRERFLLDISNLANTPEVLKFQSALAMHCFINEYIYYQIEDEDKALKNLEALVKLDLNKNKQPKPKSILCLASYKPLNNYEWCDKLLVSHEIEDVFTRQINEPKQENNLKNELPVLKKIDNKISLKVRAQYELNPYPRWVKLGLPFRPAKVSKIIDDANLKLFDDRIKEVKEPKILIAGCGTGQNSIETAALIEGSRVTAIDLSLSSLAYAKRKTKELGIENIEYMQADILDLAKLDKHFDIIESGGVLHHMDNPILGWQILKNYLKPGGLMHIGLYSELARQDIIKLREEIIELGIEAKDYEMKLFRFNVINSENKHHKQILDFDDFYSLSELRDLLFHVKEHRFTIPQIKTCLSDLGLKFCGFGVHNIVSQFKLTNVNVDDCYQLDKWHVFEEANPRVFAGMYQFWCQKISS